MAAALPQLRRDRAASADVGAGIALGNGWFRGRLGWSGGSAYYGDELAALAQLEIEFADGHVQTVVTDETWTAGPSADSVQRPLRRSDHRRTTPLERVVGAWLLRRGLDRRAPVRSCDFSTLTPYIGPPVRRQEELRPIKIWTSPAGKTLVDFGQNLVGWLRVRVQRRGRHDRHAAARRGARAR